MVLGQIIKTIALIIVYNTKCYAGGEGVSVTITVKIEGWYL